MKDFKERPESLQLSENLQSSYEEEGPRVKDARLQKTNVVWYSLRVFRDVLVRICK